jgi:hypothetical protein
MVRLERAVRGRRARLPAGGHLPPPRMISDQRTRSEQIASGRSCWPEPSSWCSPSRKSRARLAQRQSTLRELSGAPRESRR